jgi:glycosyltransferase involved in cell wall biosynthesis
MGVDPGVFERKTDYVPWGGAGPLRIFSCGRLNYVKGHQDLILAVSILRESGIDARLEIAGEDDLGGSGYRSVLEGLIADFHLRDSVLLLGAVNEQRVLQGICAAHLFVLASHHEPLGVAIMEALSCGTPVVTTNSGGVPELIDDGKDGLLVPPMKAEAMADAIRTLINQPDLELTFSRAGRAKVISGFNSDLSALKLKTLLTGYGH